MDTANILDSLERLTATGANTYRAVRGQDTDVRPTRLAPAAAFNWKPVIIGVIVLAVLGGGFLAMRKK